MCFENLQKHAARTFALFYEILDEIFEKENKNSQKYKLSPQKHQKYLHKTR
jgi:hypothetical protein